MQKAEGIYSSCTLIQKVKGESQIEGQFLNAFLMKDVAAGMPVFTASFLNRNQFWFLLKVSVSVSAQPLRQTPWKSRGWTSERKEGFLSRDYYLDIYPKVALLILLQNKQINKKQANEKQGELNKERQLRF